MTCPECGAETKYFVGWISGIKVVLIECVKCDYSRIDAPS